MVNLNNRPVLRSSTTVKMVEKPILKKRDSVVVKWVKSLFPSGTDLGSYPQFIESLLQEQPCSWYQEEKVGCIVIHRVAFQLYRLLLGIECPVEILESIWVNDLGYIYFKYLHRNPDTTEEELISKMGSLSELIKGEWDKLASLEMELDCVVEAFQLKCSIEMKHPGDIISSVKPVFYPYQQNVLGLAKSRKMKQMRKAVAQGELMFGIELEFSHSQYPLGVLYSLMTMGIFKWDSSVDGEYVTLPYKYEEMLEKITSLANTFNKLLSANGSEGNGMHVHVSRDGLTKVQVQNLKTLFLKQGVDYYSYWEQVSERGLVKNVYCKFPQQIEDYEKSRYWILNTQNEHTLEFRMFKSPTSTGKVLWNLSVVAGLLEFCKDSYDMDEWMVSPLNPMNQ